MVLQLKLALVDYSLAFYFKLFKKSSFFQVLYCNFSRFASFHHYQFRLQYCFLSHSNFSKIHWVIVKILFAFGIRWGSWELPSTSNNLAIAQIWFFIFRGKIFLDCDCYSYRTITSTPTSNFFCRLAWKLDVFRRY